MMTLLFSCMRLKILACEANAAKLQSNISILAIDASLVSNMTTWHVRCGCLIYLESVSNNREAGNQMQTAIRCKLSILDETMIFGCNESTKGKTILINMT